MHYFCFVLKPSRSGTPARSKSRTPARRYDTSLGLLFLLLLLVSLALTQECCMIFTFSVALGHALDLDLPHALAPDPGPTLAALRGAGRFLVSNHIIPAFL